MNQSNNNFTTETPLTIAIIHGWAEGEWQSREFRKLLQQNNYILSHDAKDADIVFAHSSGCYLVPVEAKAKVIILVGIPYWPGRTLLTSVLTKLVKEVTIYRRKQHLSWWMNKTVHNMWYIFTRPQASVNVVTKHNLNNLPDGSCAQVLVIRPEDDTFTTPHIQRLLSDSGYRFITLPGSHDECWLKPQEYIDVIRQAAARLQLES